MNPYMLLGGGIVTVVIGVLTWLGNRAVKSIDDRMDAIEEDVEKVDGRLADETKERRERDHELAAAIQKNTIDIARAEGRLDALEDA